MDSIRMGSRTAAAVPQPPQHPPPPHPPPSASRAPDLNPGFSPQRSTSPPSQEQQQQQQQQHHRRGYQACDPCRKRKVKCDLGSVDNPRPPPCVRCRRESKRCEFSATRRKRKASEEVEDTRPAPGKDVLRRDDRMMSADGAMAADPPPTATVSTTFDNGTNSHNNNSISSHDARSYSRGFETEVRPSAQHRWPGTSSSSSPVSQTYASHNQAQPQPQPQPRPQRSSFSSNSRSAVGGPHALESGQHMMNKTAADLLSPAITNTHDALHLLSEAAGRTEDLRRQREYNYPTTHHPQHSSNLNTSTSSMGHVGTSGNVGPSHSTTTTTQQQQQQQGSASMGWYGPRKAGSVSFEHGVDAGGSTTAQATKSSEDVDYENARRVWSRLRFIRAGWFSVDEAMAYVAYYYEHLAPLSPIVVPNFSSPSTHLTLLMEEPVLTVTMLTIASRHMKLTGNGANSRAYSIHEKLWSYLRGMIERLFWGQEKFGDGSPAAGFSKPRQFTLSNPPLSGQADFNGQLRSLGTVEALLLLTDWHPRALHFPPGDDENTLLDMDAQLLTQINDGNSKEDDKAQTTASEGRQAFYKWLEPVWRSDRMSWMLLSAAQALAFELGVFDHKNDLKNSTESSSEQARKRRVRRLILVYSSQSSGRLGIPPMLPFPQWNQDTEPVFVSDNPLSHEDYAIDVMQDCWMDISKIMYITNQELFPSKEHTSNLIKSGQYRDRIDEFVPSLHGFKRKLDGLANVLTPQMRYILTLEYEYTRVYINCMALQAVVDRWTTITNETVGTNEASGPTAPLRVLLEQYEVNEPYIQEVVDASRKILQTVLDDFVPGDYLQHAPVRTFFRILSGMIFILKTFTLGAKEDDVRVSLELQDRTVETLRNCVVDDVHLSVTIADLLQLLTANIRTRFLRFAPFERGDQSPSRERTPVAPSSPQAARDQSTAGDYRWQQQQQQQPQQQQQQQQQAGGFTSNFTFDNTNPPPVTSQNDPLAHIPAQPINATNLNVSFMPPPPSYYNYFDAAGATSPKMEDDSSTAVPPHSTTLTGDNNNNNNNNTNGTTNANGTTTNSNPNPTMSDWFALPLDQFFNSSTAGVDQGLGGTGPMVGEFDMLEILLKEQYPSTPGGDGSGHQYM